MGAYAAISLLKNTLEQLRQPNPRLICRSEQLVESTYQNLCALQAFLEDATKEANDIETLKDLEKKIITVVYRVEDAVDSSLRNIILAESRKNQQRASRSFLSYFSKNQSDPERACKSFNHELQGVEKEVDSLREEVMQIEFNKNGRKYGEAAKPSSSSSGSATDDLQNVVVGMKDDFNTILDRLTSQTDELIVIPIVGMGGIGKTTLARKVYLDSSIIHRFDKHAWVTISETYNERQILLELVSSISRDRTDEGYQKMSTDELAESVYRGLKRRRYLIVIDDLWSTDPWDQMRRSFPEDNNKSRILLTTRLNHVAKYAGCPEFPPHSVSFLSLGDSWSLFTKRLLKDDSCPPQLEKIGKCIIQQCRGLPLSIVVIAGLLGKMEPTYDNWKRVEKNLNLFLDTVSEKCEAILCLSYTYLPQYLKACFLYVGGFPEDMEISVSKLIELWIAEQFIKARSNRTLEAVADEYLQELIDRSLIIVGRRRPNGRIKTCKIHDVLRQLCIKRARSENVVHSMNQNMFSIFSRGINNNERRVMAQITRHATHEGYDFTSSTRSLVFMNYLYKPLVEGLCSSISHLKLLKVLDVLSIKNDFSDAIPRLVHLRYVAANIAKTPSLSKLWNLQTIIFVVLDGHASLELPPEIWTMTEMRHLKVVKRIYMPNPLDAEGRRIGEHPLFLNNLQRLHLTINDSTHWVEIFRRTPNVNKLKICVNLTISMTLLVELLGLLQGLEILHIRFSRSSLIPSNWEIFLPNLNQLKLTRTSLSWKGMAVLAKLPNLEVLKTWRAFNGSFWRLHEDVEFHRLRYLQIEHENFRWWEEVNNDNFPMLEQLVLRKLYHLKEIPQSMAEIITLNLIKIHKCSSGVISSAKKIQEEQQSWGNYELQVQIRSWGS